MVVWTRAWEWIFLQWLGRSNEWHGQLAIRWDLNSTDDLLQNPHLFTDFCGRKNFFCSEISFFSISYSDSCPPYLENGLCFYTTSSYRRFTSSLIRPYSRASSLNECITRCKNDARCKSFFHVKSTGFCVLMSALCEKSDSRNYRGINHYDINSCSEGNIFRIVRTRPLV